MPDNTLFSCYYSLQKSELQSNMILDNQTVTQEALLKEMSDGGDMKSLFQILISRKYYVQKACNFIKKETLVVQMLSSEFYQISKNTFSTKHL